VFRFAAIGSKQGNDGSSQVWAIMVCLLGGGGGGGGGGRGGA